MKMSDESAYPFQSYETLYWAGVCLTLDKPIIVKMGDNFNGCKNTLKIIFQLGDTWFKYLEMLENVLALVSILY